MPSITIVKKPRMEADCTVSNLRFVSVPKMSFEVEVTFDKKIFDQVKDDAILLEDMNQAAMKVYTTTCKAIQGKMKTFDKLFEGMADAAANKPAKEQAKVKKTTEDSLNGLNAALEQDRVVAQAGAKAEVDNVWSTYQKKKKEYKTYKIKIAVTIIGAAAGLVTSIALMATSAFTGGVSAAMSIIGMFKSAVTLVREIGSAWAEIETSQKLLEKQIGFVEKAAEGVAKRRANEITAMILDNFLGVANPSLKSCESALETVQKKLIGIEIKTHEASKLLNQILDKQEGLKKDFLQEASARVKKQAPAKANELLKGIEGRLDDALAPSYAQVVEQIGKVNELYETFKTAKQTTDAFAKRIAALKSQIPKSEENLMTFARNVLTVTSMPLGAMSGNGIASSASDLASGIGSAAAGFAYDKISGKALGGTFLA